MTENTLEGSWISFDDQFVFRTPALGRWYVDRSRPGVAQLVDALIDESLISTWSPNDLKLYRRIEWALMVGAPGLLPRLRKNRDRAKSGHWKSRSTLSRYVYRMSNRPTPFGLFSSLSYGSVSEKTGFIPGSATLHGFFGGKATHEILERVRQLAYEKHEASYVMNPTAHRQNDRIIFLQLGENNVGLRQKKFMEKSYDFVDADRGILGLMSAFNQPTQRTRVIQGLPEELAKSVSSLIDKALSIGLLIREPLNTLSEADAFKALLQRDIPESSRKFVNQAVRINRWASSLTEGESPLPVIRAASQLLNEATRATIGGQADISKKPKVLARGVGESDSEQPLHFDMFRHFEQAELSKALMQSLSNTVNMLATRTARPNVRSENLRKQFNSRFPEGYASLADFISPGNGIDPRRKDPVPAVMAFEASLTQFLCSRLVSAKELKDYRIDLDAFNSPTSFAYVKREYGGTAVAVFRRSSGESIETYLRGTAFANGLQMIARFGDLAPEVAGIVDRRCKEVTKTIHPAIPLEVYCLDNVRARDVTIRPGLSFNHGLLHADVSLPKRTVRVGIDDLVVVSEDSQLRVYHKTTGSRIIPQLSSAHGNQLSGSNRLYQILPLLQTSSTFGFYWPSAFKGCQHLPAVYLNGTLLCAQSWLIPRATLDSIISAPWPEKTSRLRKFGIDFGLPRYIEFGERDRVLTVDMLDDASMLSAVGALSLETTRVYEAFQTPESEIIKGINGLGYSNEFIFNFNIVRPKANGTEGSYSGAILRGQEAKDDVTKAWIYYRLYISQEATASALRELGSLMQRLEKAGRVDRWFYVRYSDPRYHIRLRLEVNRMDERRDAVEVELRRVFDTLRRPDGLFEVEIAEYKRELYRYSGPAFMDIAEGIFWMDSRSTSEILLLLEDMRFDEAEDAEIICQAIFVKKIFELLNTHDPKKLVSLLGRTVGINPGKTTGKSPAKPIWNKRFSRLRTQLAALFEAVIPVQATKSQAAAYHIALQRNNDIAEFLGRSNFAPPAERTVLALTHMSANRLFKDWNPNKESEARYLVYRSLSNHCHKEALLGDPPVKSTEACSDG